ncbi:MAG: Valyl-tRNA synthetase [Ktedonobacterales bacterium]|jgi:valyl-tRNA synthetase|nr:MAG: Valyl-tRNA synthetase [Ktedonobacterales bacterium]
MALAKQYDPGAIEPEMQAFWQRERVYDFALDDTTRAPVYAIDTPPPTVSGHLHLGHVYSYSHTDFLARFRRMRGDNVYYPMGFDDNGLPTERLVEKRYGVTAPQIGRAAFIAKCLEVSEEAEQDYQALWRRLGLSIDYCYTYRTIDDNARRTSQWSFLDLHRKGLVYRQDAPAIWCPECQTAIAQAELSDLERETTFYTLAFRFADGETLPIATTRPELLPACVAVFVHPNDPRYANRTGQMVTTPLGDEVPLLADAKADPAKGTGAVMCCTFGDTTDIEWWREYSLPLRIILGRDGRLTEAAGAYAGLTASAARARIIADLDARGLLLAREPMTQTVRVHERCDTPVEYIVTPQWFVRALDFKAELIAAGERIAWHPEHMGARYREWVENLKWDWNISRQRYFGVPIPVWYCDACGEALVADEAQLPVDPTTTEPPRACACGGGAFTPEPDVMDTWATSSMSPQIIGRMLDDPALYARVFPFTLRPQAHEIIRTWAFYTILKSLHHFGALPWRDVAISGWGLAGEGEAKISKSRGGSPVAAKISKSRGGGPIAPAEAMTRFSADAARYWAASTGPGKDSVISEEKMRNGLKLATKLWNVARFSERFIADDAGSHGAHLALTPTDRWLLSRAERLIQRVTELMEGYEWAAAKAEVEAFFWRDLADNYLEMAKARLYDADDPGHAGAVHTLTSVLLAVLKMFAPFLPHVAEAIYQGIFAASHGGGSIHRARWPVADDTLIDEQAEAAGEALVALATAARRYKSERGIALGAELARIQIATDDAALAETLRAAETDIRSVTRARKVEFAATLDPALEAAPADGAVGVAIER